MKVRTKSEPRRASGQRPARIHNPLSSGHTIEYPWLSMKGCRSLRVHDLPRTWTPITNVPKKDRGKWREGDLRRDERKDPASKRGTFRWADTAGIIAPRAREGLSEVQTPPKDPKEGSFLQQGVGIRKKAQWIEIKETNRPSPNRRNPGLGEGSSRGDDPDRKTSERLNKRFKENWKKIGVTQLGNASLLYWLDPRHWLLHPCGLGYPVLHFDYR